MFSVASWAVIPRLWVNIRIPDKFFENKKTSMSNIFANMYQNKNEMGEWFPSYFRLYSPTSGFSNCLNRAPDHTAYIERDRQDYTLYLRVQEPEARCIRPEVGGNPLSIFHYFEKMKQYNVQSMSSSV